MFLKCHKCIPKRQIYATQKATPPFAATSEQAIINVSSNRGDVPKGTVSISSTNDLFPAAKFKVKIISLHCI